jgi:hypothetical protein
MQGRQFARVLNERLTERGLARIINKSPDIRVREIRVPTISTGRKTKRRRRTRGALKAGPPPRKRPPYLERVKKEFHILICTNDKRYASLRRAFSRRESQVVIVGTLASGIAESLWISVAVTTPIVAGCLLGFVQMGINAYCAGKR